MLKHKDVIKLLEKSKERKKLGAYIVEGPKMVYEAIGLGLVMKAWVSESFINEATEPLACDYEVLDDKKFKELSGTVTPQGIIAAVKMNQPDVDDILSDALSTRILILENLQDPGNLGTIIRTAEAAGYNGIFMNKGTVDIYNPKVVRSTMGAIFRVPFLYFDEITDIFDTCRTNGVHIYGAALSGKDIREVTYADRSAFVIGNESKGISKETLSMCDELIKIPMAGSVESLNASVAAGLLMYLSNLSYL